MRNNVCIQCCSHDDDAMMAGDDDWYDCVISLAARLDLARKDTDITVNHDYRRRHSE